MYYICAHRVLSYNLISVPCVFELFSANLGIITLQFNFSIKKIYNERFVDKMIYNRYLPFSLANIIYRVASFAFILGQYHACLASGLRYGSVFRKRSDPDPFKSQDSKYVQDLTIFLHISMKVMIK